MENVDFIEYDRRLIKCAKDHRKQQTRAETLFGGIVRNRKIGGYKFKREKAIGEFILDFYCSELLLGIEIDGGYHNETQDYDEERSKGLYDNYNIKIVRFTNDEVEKNTEGVYQYMEELIKDRQMSGGTSPQPSPNREGDLVFSSSDRRMRPKAGGGKTVKL